LGWIFHCRRAGKIHPISFPELINDVLLRGIRRASN
jgi:hypothetical protein